jgi:hypothetical protein
MDLLNFHSASLAVEGLLSGNTSQASRALGGGDVKFRGNRILAGGNTTAGLMVGLPALAAGDPNAPCGGDNGRELNVPTTVMGRMIAGVVARVSMSTRPADGAEPEGKIAGMGRDPSSSQG